MEYEDLLNELRDVGDLRWILSPHGPSQTPSTPSEAIKEYVFNSDRVRDVITRLSTASTPLSPDGLPQEPPTPDALRTKVRAILDEMGHQYNMKYVRLMGYVLIKAVRRMYDHVWVNTETLHEMQSKFSDPSVPIVLMPTHRSYADFLLVSFVAFHYALPLPIIASGIDFLGMFGVSQVLRRAGAFFIRRSFADDILYRTVFSEYIQAVVCGLQPLEFFVEGTRSRSGKSLYPKFGLLQTAVEVFLRGKVSDITVVPISITYERTLEEFLYARELLGIPKPRESTSGLLKARKVLGDCHGSIWFHMGRGISVRDFLTGRVDRSLYGVVPRSRIVMDAVDTPFIKDLAIAVIREQQSSIKVHNWAVLATVLLHRLRKSETFFAVSSILQECNDFLVLVSHTAADHERRQDFTQDSLTNCLRIHGNVIRYGADTTVLEFQPNLLSHLDVLHILLAHYRNHAVHRVIVQAFRVLVKKVSWCSGDPGRFLCRLFSREFALDSKSLGPCVPVEPPTPDYLCAAKWKPSDPQSLLESIAEPFLIGYDILLHVMQSSLFATRSVFRTPKELGLLLQKAVCTLLDMGIYGGCEILSSDLISNCIQALKPMDALLVRDGQLVLNRRVIVDLTFQLNTFIPVEAVLNITDTVEKAFGHIAFGAKI
ncbi:dihydroxyacetone phosphate acyltransferase-like [Paramacrobiotus metropolitanus]|uniref:dihydroxyacetone phosphate acyltransferase-like n=1 Tax=Paramacrobiotus metropolitanus TaxID=2943436 RepID=UPI002446220E|nr:dihydroxyacetone phosphate acyltransferase-like [Paramacrobiotus metropolitanus]